MSKTNGAVRKVSRNFETVALEVVKEVAVADPPIDQTIVEADEAIKPAEKRVVMPVPTRAPAGKKRSA